MKVTIFGATGALGVECVAQCLEAGHEVTVLARRPAKLAIAWHGLSPGTSLVALCQTSSNPAWVTEVFSLSATSWALGPTMAFPWVVAVTRMPLLMGVGTGNMTLLTVILALPAFRTAQSLMNL